MDVLCVTSSLLDWNVSVVVPFLAGALISVPKHEWCNYLCFGNCFREQNLSFLKEWS